MSLQTETKEIGSYTYAVSTLDAIKGRQAFVRLANVVSSVFKHAGTPEDLVPSILAALNEKDVDHFCELFGNTTTVTGGDYGDKTPLLNKQTFMTHFAGNYLDMFEWLAFCIEVNFGSFFKGIGGLVKKIAPQLAVEEVKKPA